MHRSFAMALLLTLGCSAAIANDQCSYSSYRWNVTTRQAVDHQRIEKLRSALSRAEYDAATGCSVCEQDQTELRLPGLRPFKVCKQLASRYRHLLLSLQKAGAPVRDVVGYRVGMTRGPTDAAGNRTGFSNHAFGIALDINTDHNGLYDRCEHFGPHCRLLKGGPWNPGHPASLTADSLIVQTFKQNGFRWGGEIAGQQKDFMHFSPSGY